MPTLNINYLAVLIAAIINMVLGMLWYSPVMFAKTWMAASGRSPDDMKGSSAGPMYLINTVASLVLAYVLSMFISYAGARTAVLGAQMGLWAWLGFAVTTILPVYLFEGRSKKLYLIYISYQLVSFILMGIILAIWV